MQVKGDPISTTFVSGKLKGMSGGGSNTSSKTSSKNKGKMQPSKGGGKMK